MIAESPRNRSFAAASRLALATSQFSYGARMRLVTRPAGIGGVTEDQLVCFSHCVPPVACSRWHCVRRHSPFQPPPLQQGPTTAQGGPRTRMHAGHHAGGTTPIHQHRRMARLIALGCRRRADEFARPCRRQCQPAVEHLLRRRRHVRRLRFVERGRRGAPLHRRQPDRPRQPVVRALHEHGAAALRLSRHRLGHGALVRQATASAYPDRRSAPSP